MKLFRLDSLVIEQPTKPLDAALAIRNQLVENKLRGLREEFSAGFKKFLQQEKDRTESDDVRIPELETIKSIQELGDSLKTEILAKDRYRTGLCEELHMLRLKNAADEVRKTNKILGHFIESPG